MRNLEITKILSFHFDALKDTKLACHDPVTDCIYFISNQGLHKLDFEENKVLMQVTFAEHDCFLPNISEKIVHLSFLIEQDSVCFITEDGDIFLYHVLHDQVESVGEVTEGVETASWSLDGNNLVLITGGSSIVIMNRDFEILNEFPLFGSELGENQFVSVGWGKRETQFQGSQGKAAALETNNSNLIISSETEDKKSLITWNGDGQSFAVNTCTPNSGGRQIRIFSVDGNLQAVTEEICSLESEVHWQPSGCLLAASQRLPTKYQILFIERNGLQHGEFSLPKIYYNFVVERIIWNADSTLLAICLRNEDKTSYELQIWSRGNYHWYLKQTIKLPKGQSFLMLFWHSEKPLSLMFVTSEGCYKRLHWVWNINRSRGLAKENDVFVGVVDTCKILLTPFRRMVIPPPAAAIACELPSPVNFILFPKLPCSPYSVASVLADDQIAVISIDENNSSTIENIYNLKWTDDIVNEKHHPLLLHHWIWPKFDLFLAVFSTESSSVLCKISKLKEQDSLAVQQLHEFDELIVKVCFSETSDIFLQTSSGQILTYSIENNLVTSWKNSSGRTISFPYECHSIESCIYSEKELIFGLSHNFRLYYEDVEILNNCSSFDLHDEFLLATTLNHTLRCISLSSFIHNLMNLNSEAKETVRNIERGSRIVACIPKDTKLILQMPRGNLECIHPRPLSITAVARFLDELKFHDAFILMRRHRINMNLFFDHNPTKFFENIDKFLSDVNNVDWLNVFLTDLCNENAAATIYKDIYHLMENRKELSVYSNKVNTVCKAIRLASMKADRKKYFLLILTTYILIKPSELEDALIIINDLKRNENDLDLVEKALKYLQYLVDEIDMYDAALGTYNFDLVIMIAQKSQKDPKELLPFLNDFHNMEENYQKFSIDKYLKRPVKALENIVKCGKKYFDECLAHIQLHNLYKKALTLFEKNSEEYQQICLSYAKHLERRHKLEEAAIFYHRGGCSNLALEVFEQNLNWQEALHMAFIIGHDETQVIQLAQSLAGKLKERNQHKDAAHLLELYAKQPEESIATLIEGHHWQMALEAISRHRRSDLILTHLNPTLKEYSSSLLNNIEKAKSLFERYSTRLMVLREEKQKNITKDNESIFNDAASEISNVTSITNRTLISGTNSRISGRTCRSQRKEERKKHSLKEGSVYEERALLEALAEIANSADNLKEECTIFLHMLLIFDFDKEAQTVQKELTELTDMINKQLHLIWKFPPNFLNQSQNMLNNAPPAELPFSKAQYSSIVEETRLMLPPIMKSGNWKTDVFDE